MTIGCYMRVSTTEQDCASQRHEIERWLATNTKDTVVWYQDDGISGSTMKRPELQRLCRDVESGAVDTVLCYKIDRLSRNAPDAMQLLLRWIQLGAGFVAVTQPILSLSKDNPMRLTIAALFSELAALEREMIVGRTKAGLAAARARGTRLGAVPKLSAAQVLQAMTARRDGARIDTLATRFGVSTATMSRALRRGGKRDVSPHEATDPG